MYNKYFGFEEQPFSIAPDPRYLYMSEQHRESLAHLVYGFNSDGGFVLLTGEVGTGKTTVCRCLLEQVPDNSSIALVINPKLTVNELLATICDEFGIKYPSGNTSLKVFIDLINEYLCEAHAKNKKVVLIIDEAQNLSAEVLEQLRLLTNLETNKRKLLQIILLGQPELRDKLGQPELRQLSQRIIARYHLGPLSKKDLGAYVTHRISVAGLEDELFPSSTIDRLYILSRGIPRIINLLCDRALLGTFTQGKHKVSSRILNIAAKEVLETPKFKHGISTTMLVAALILTAFSLVSASAYFYYMTAKKSSAISVIPDTKATDQAHVNVLDKLKWPDTIPIKQSKETAYRSVFSIWGITYSDDNSIPPCQQAQSKGLRCLKGLGSMESIRTLNLPVILTLHNEAGEEYYATLITLTKDIGSLNVGGRNIEASVKDIESQWLGDYTLLWKTPPEYSGDIKPGDKGVLVKWLDTHLAVINNRKPVQGDVITYDNALVNELKKFQLAEGLVPDGIAGAQTIIHLNTATAEEMPTLTGGIKKN
ncbi:MAG: AAA family ATPase [Thermodesulfovibrionia bacterium]|nr:AAA family ATPase [Thermodesulfovibrionia bacterium]